MSEATEFSDLLPRRASIIFSIGLMGGFLATLTLALFVLIARSAAEDGHLLPVGDVALSAGPLDGLAVASASGCLACHSTDGSASLGPTWSEAFGNARLLVSGDSVTIDRSYVERSILDPRAQLAEGFPGTAMPTSYGDTLSLGEIDAIIDFIAGLQTAGG